MKQSRIVLLVLLVLALLVALVSCTDDAGSGTTDTGNTGGNTTGGTTDTGNTGGGTHTHTYAVAWTSDADYHWHAATCGHADEVKDKAAHTYENGACMVCGRAEPAAPHTHTYADAWTSDADYHWHAATCGHADAVKDKAAHTYENGSCTVCGRAEPEGDLDPSAKLLEYLPLPDGTLSVSEGQAKLLDKIVIPAAWKGKAVTAIADQGFQYCTNLTSITIPSSVTSVGARAFSGSSLTDVYITDIAAWCKLEFNYSYRNNPVLGANLYLNGTLVTDLVIPEGVTSIGQSAFSACRSLTSITIPSSVTSMGRYAFSACRSLTSVTISDGVTSIGDEAFWSCRSLTSITIPSSVTSIGYSAFSDCTSLTSITISEGVTSIGMSAFSLCTNLTSITIPASVTSIKRNAFSGCKNLAKAIFVCTDGWFMHDGKSDRAGVDSKKDADNLVQGYEYVRT